MTDLYTLVIKTVGASGDERTGVRAAEGKIEAGTYSANGRTRTKGYEFDFASLGLEGYAWEYLGAEVEIDLTGAEPKIISTPEKSTFCVTRDEISLDEAGKIATVRGVEFDLSVINYGWLRTNTLLNEGGQYIPGWNDKSTIKSGASTVFKSEKYVSSYYFFTKATQFNQTMLVCYADTTYSKDVPLPEGAAKGPATLLVAGDFLLFDFDFQTTFRNLLKAGGDEYNFIHDTITTEEPKTNASRLEFYELFTFDADQNCKGFGTDERGRRTQGYFEEGVDIAVMTVGRRDFGTTKSALRSYSAAKWLSENYPDVTYIFIEEQPYKDGTFELPASKGNSVNIGNASTGSTAAEHLANIKTYNAAIADAMTNVKPVFVKVGSAFLAASEQGLDLYGTVDPYLTHANASGTYLAAVMIYEAVTGKEAPETEAEFVKDPAGLRALAAQFR